MVTDIMPVIEKVFVLFLAMFAGVVARKFKIIDEKSTKTLSSLLVNVTNPLLMIYSFQLDFDMEKLKTGGLIFVASIIIHICLSLVSKLFFFKTKHVKQRSVYEFAVIFANCGFMGFPVLMAIYGDIGLFYGAFFTGYFNIFIWTYGVYIMNRREKAEGQAKYKIQWKKIFLNTGLLSIVCGILLFILRIRLPLPVYDAFKMVGDMTFPLSMIIIGSLVSVLDFKKLLKSFSIYGFVLTKLLVVPLLTIGVCYILKPPTLISNMCIVMSAMPSATNTAVFTEIYDGDSPLAAKCVGMTNLFSLITIPFVLFVMNSVFAG